MYKVIKHFFDIGGHEYNEGDTYPCKGEDASTDRIAQLRDGNNFYHVPFIEEVKTPKKK